MIKLTIAIPTYNRSAKLISLLIFLDKEIHQLDDQHISEIEVLISDNCSNDDTEKCVTDYLRHFSSEYSIKYNRNKTNLGIEGNYKTLAELAIGKYFWVLGDDDIYIEGIVARVFEEVNKDYYSYIFLNHKIKTIYGVKDTVLPSININREDSDVLLDIFDVSGGCLMFISASIHLTNNVRDCLSKYQVNIAVPIMVSFYSGSLGKVKLISDTYIIDDITGISWGEVRYKVYLRFIPYYLRTLFGLSYSKSKCLYIYFDYFWKKRNMIKNYYIVNPLRKLIQR